MSWTLERLYVEAGMKEIPSFAKFVTLKHTPYQKQIEGLTLAYNDDWFGLYDEAGLGKTNIAQAFGILHIANGNKVVVVTIPTLAYQFEEQFTDEFIGIEKYVRAEVVDYGPAERDKRFAELSKEPVWPMLIMSHELFYREYARLIRLGFNVIIVDEAWKLKSVESGLFLRVKEFRGKERGDAALLLMNGTPLHNEAIDAYASIALTNPAAYQSYDDFDKQHCAYKLIRLAKPVIMRSGRKITKRNIRIGYKRLEKVHAALYRHGRRVLVSDVYEINDPIITRVPVVLSPDHLELYHKLARERILEMGDEAIISAVSEQELRQKVCQIISCPELFVMPDVVIENRIVQTTLDLVESKGTNSGDKVILFCFYRQTVEHFQKLFESYNPAVLYGGVTASQRKVQLAKFKQDDSCKMLVANWKSAGAGHNFQDYSSTVIFPEAIGVPGDFTQAMKRVCRNGQKYTPNIYLLSARGTVAPKILDNMLYKEATNQEVYQDRRSLFHYYCVSDEVR